MGRPTTANRSSCQKALSFIWLATNNIKSLKLSEKALIFIWLAPKSTKSEITKVSISLFYGPIDQNTYSGPELEKPVSRGQIGSGMTKRGGLIAVLVALKEKLIAHTKRID